MQLEECYASFQGNYEDVKSRLVKEDLIRRLVLKFLKDTSFEELSNAMEQKDYGAAFRAVHTLKGLSLNFGFDCLSKSAGALTETLRKWESEPVDEALCEKQWQQVSADYGMITDAIRKLEDAE
ncbi:MAG: Hpt domain-containing protein [Lachnospiraceae bacterium]